MRPHVFSQNEAVLIGQLSLDPSDRSNDGLFHRSSGVKGPKFDLGISAILEENRCQIETIDDLSFSVLLSQLESQRRAFAVFNPTRSNSKFTIHVPELFRISDSNDGKSNLKMDIEVELAKGQRRVYYLHFRKVLETFFICSIDRFDPGIGITFFKFHSLSSEILKIPGLNLFIESGNTVAPRGVSNTMSQCNHTETPYSMVHTLRGAC